MIPKNESCINSQPSAKELSWMNRMQLKIESLCEIDPARNSADLVQETSAYFEKQISTVGTNMRKFCAEFVKELLDTDKVETPDVDGLKSETGLNNDLHSDTDKPSKLSSAKGLNAPVFDPEGSVSGSMLEDGPKESITEVQVSKEDGEEAVVLNEAQEIPFLEETVICEQSVLEFQTEEEPEQQVHWFVSEEYRNMRIGKSTSSSSLQSWEGHQRAPSSDSLLDWELV